MKKKKKEKWIPKLSDHYNEIETESWFDIREYQKNPNYHSSMVCFSDRIFIRAEKIILYPNKKQVNILQKWFNLSRKMYNKTTDFLNKKIFINKKISQINVKKYVNFRKLRSNYLKEAKESLCLNNINKHILDQSIARCVAMYKSSLTKIKKKQIKDFRVRKIKKDKRYKTLLIEGCLFSKVKNGFCISVLGEIPSNESLENISETCILSYDKYNSKYTLSVPKYIEPKEYETRNLICGIDPGVRTFLTVYSKEDVYQIGNDIDFNKYFYKIDRLNQICDSKESKQTRKYKRAIGKVYDKINNKVKDMHFKVAKFLCTRYKILKIGNLSTSKIVSNETSVLKESTKRLLYSLSHYKFREKLINQAEKYGVNIKIVSEYLTTKKCSKCEKKNEVGKNKIYKCGKCNLKVDRDINAAKNIRYV
ncbi:putative transposase [Tupanvirus soda lake]|uniref:Transposase n=2 Tax=Tupanvirus TaxID=2094720 RepID=A0AC62ADG6_9VIRU|nr:putative transposase [Tupanvirus soda lake]QKU35668.1 putative transposase [Tupanvirus soda lake]